MTILPLRPVRERPVHDGAAPHGITVPFERPEPVAAVGFTTVGRVSSMAPDGACWVDAEPGDVLLTRVAVSCIVKPQTGDLVQLYRTSNGCWVLAILERRDDGKDVELDFGASSVLLQAHDVRLEARDRLTLEAAHLASRAAVVTQAAAERQTHVSGTDSTHAGNAFVHAERHLGLHAKSAIVKSESLLKIDAGQIHMG